MKEVAHQLSLMGNYILHISYIVKKMVIIAHHPRRGGKADARVAPMIATTTNCLGKISKNRVKMHIYMISKNILLICANPL